jgi:hypothetical protein
MISNVAGAFTGVQQLAEAMLASGTPPAGVRAGLWQSAWARGYDDLAIPLTRPDTIVGGAVIFAHACGSWGCVAVVDDGAAAWGILAGGPPPPLGARVRAVPNYGAGPPWLLTMLERPSFGLEPCFTADAQERQTQWIEQIRGVLARIRDREVLRRAIAEARRRTLPPATLVEPLRDEMRRRHAELKARVEAETAPRRAELVAFNAANERVRQRIVAERSARRLSRYREELENFRRSMPAFLAEREARSEAGVDLCVMAQHLEDTLAQSRAITDRTLRIGAQLDAIENSTLAVAGDPGEALRRTDAALIDDIGRTVGLIFALLPRSSVASPRARSRATSSD